MLDLTEELKVSLTAFMLNGEAEHWWQFKKEVLPTPTTWEVFMDALFDNFFPAYIRKKKEEEFQDIRQGNITVAQYAVRFVQLSRFTHLMVTPQKAKN